MPSRERVSKERSDEQLSGSESAGAKVLRRVPPISFLLVLTLGCQSWLSGSTAPRIAVDSALEVGATPWTSLDPLDLNTDFDFVVVSDRTGGHREGVFRGAMLKVNLIQPAFVLSVGDLIEGYTDDQTELALQWDEIADMVAPLEMPFFYAAGNHDMSNEVMSQLWRDRFGPSYYSFIYKDVLFVVLNSELFGMVSDPSRPVPGPESQQEQMDWLEAVLSENSSRRYTFVIVHQPLWDDSREHPQWENVEEWLGTRPYTVLAGHFHAYTKHIRHDRRYITLATTGGGSGLRGLDHGEFDHFMLVSMREEGPVFANLLLDGVWDEDVRTSENRKRLQELEGALEMVLSSPVDPEFRQGAVEFEVTNSAAENLDLEARFESAGNLEVQSKSLQAEIAPGETRRFNVELKASNGAQNLGDTHIPKARWRLEGVKEDGTPLVVERDAWLLPRARFFLSSAAADIEIDGELGEWPLLPYHTVPLAEFESQAAFRFAVAYDEDFLYLAVDVSDSTPVNSEELIAREQDALLINVDARSDPERSASGQGYFAAIKDGTLRQLFVAWVTPVEAEEDSLLLRLLSPLPEGTRQVAIRREGGYTAELAIPAFWLDERQGKPWEAVRIELSVQDFAEKGGKPALIVFRPSRFDRGGVLPMPGSSTFERIPGTR